jgi:UrcA family protein
LPIVHYLTSISPSVAVSPRDAHRAAKRRGHPDQVAAKSDHTLRKTVMKTLAAATAVAVALTAAGAASARDVRVAYGDLDLSTAHGAQIFDRRVSRAVRSACQGGSPLEASRCVVSLRAELHSLMPASAQRAYALSRARLDNARAPSAGR